MILSFELSMPNNNAWNGKWTGEGTLYAIVKNFGRGKKANVKAQQLLDKGYYRYNFGDGWSAGISVESVSAKDSAKLRRKSAGFCGYDWMVRSILEHGKIQT